MTFTISQWKKLKFTKTAFSTNKGNRKGYKCFDEKGEFLGYVWKITYESWGWQTTKGKVGKSNSRWLASNMLYMENIHPMIGI